MSRHLIQHIAMMTEMREPHKALERAAGKPVAILMNSAVVGCLVPIAAISNQEHRVASLVAVMESLERTRAQAQPVLDYLKDE